MSKVKKGSTQTNIIINESVETAPVEVKPKKKKNYLNNKDMIIELRKCHEQDKMTDEFAKMIMLLAERYGGRYEYADYGTHVEDMKAAAVINVVRAWRGFDLTKSNNPFAYFTQAIKHTFWQYVSQEKKHRLNRDAILISLGELPSDAFMDDYEKEMGILKSEMDDPDTSNLDDVDSPNFQMGSDDDFDFDDN